MNQKVVSLAAVTNNPIHESPEKLLRDLLSDIKSGHFGKSPRFVVCINPRSDEPGFFTDYISCGLSAEQAIGLLEVVKLRIYHERAEPIHSEE